ncbi:hypothetical protein GIB67_026386 [Kingdonia uniflora]|uniref:DUF659 domain-containing protein n=1 Tax=Kingdonia uniflora TaxID=39325 RepID=A0A7J7P6U0_9MAGN|nr:hypothetical protein GIB67_026386 [Kingdonia uniflora]
MSSNVAEGSQGSTGRYRPANSNDPGWDYGQPADGNRDHVKCDFCGHVSKGGIKRKTKATEDKQNKKDEMIRNVNVYGNDEEVEEVGIQIPKKRKGTMDAFIAPIDVEFRPRAPTSNENKKALENIHGYIVDFFYENNISFNCARSNSYSKMMQAIVQYNDPSRTVFLKSIDGPAHIHDAELIYKMLKDVIEEVGEKNVIQICTDNASNYVLAGDWIMGESKIYWMPCAVHFVNLMLGDVSKMYLVDETVKDVKKISLFIYNHKHVHHLIRKQTKDVIRMVDIEEKPYMAYIYSAIEDCKLKAGRLGMRGAQACVKTIAPVEWWITFGSEVPALQKFAKRIIGLTSVVSPCERISGTFDNIHTKKRNCLEHDRMRDLAYIQYNKRLKKWTDMTYDVLEDAEDGFDDPSLTRTSRTSTASHCSQGGASSSRSTARHLQDSSDDDDYDVDANYDVGDGIDLGSDEDI